MAYRPFSLALLTAGLLLVGGSLSPALAQWIRLDVCNKGNVTVDVAWVFDDNGGWGRLMEDGVGEGWRKIPPDDCERLMLVPERTFRRVWLSFLYKDNTGNIGISRVGPEKEGPFQPSTESFCVKTSGFTFRVRPLSGAQDCPDIAAFRGPIPNDQFVRVPFTLLFQPYQSGVFDTSSFTFNVSPDSRIPVTFPLPFGNSASLPTATVTPAPAIVPPRPAPTPFQAATATATFLGKTIARWREGDGQWFYDNGSAVQGIRDAPYNNLGLFDWPPAYDTLPEGVIGALQTLQSSLTRDFRLATDGRLSIFSPDGTVWRTTSLQSLDVQNAQSYLGFLSIPCRTDHQHCVYENTSGLSDTLLIWVDNAAASKTALDGMRELKKLFGDPIRVVREDANCSCLRYDVGVGVTQDTGASSAQASNTPARPGPAVGAGENLPAAHAETSSAEAVRGKSAAWYTILVLLACGVVVAFWNRIRSALPLGVRRSRAS